jgi:transposase
MGVPMSDLFWLTDAQMERLKPFFPLSHGVPRVDDRRVLSGIIFINRNGLRWRDAPAAYGPPKTLCNRWKRWGRAGDAPLVQANLRGWGSSPG